MKFIIKPHKAVSASASTFLSTHPTSLESAQSEYSKPSGKREFDRVFIKHQAAKCLGRRNKYRKRRKRHSGHAARTVLQKCFPFGPRSTIARATAFARVTVFYLTTKAHDAAKLSSHAKSRAPSLLLSMACNTNYIWAIWMRSATGVMRRNM